LLTFHTFFKESFSGETPEDVLAAVYAESAPSTGLTYSEWWAYQQRVWRTLYGIVVPDLDSPCAHARLLEILVDVGALLPGKRPPDTPALPNPAVSPIWREASDDPSREPDA
jgi:hypothetical protein